MKQKTFKSIEDNSNVLRKVRSLDCVRPTSVQQHFIYNAASSVVQELKASRFSVQARKYKLSPTLECSELHEHNCKILGSTEDNMPRSPLVSILSPSASAVSLVGLVDSTDQDYKLLCSILDSMTNLRCNLRFRVLNALVFSVLILATFTRYRRDNSSSASFKKKFPSSSSSLEPNKSRGLLGPAMIESVTEALSPILPFAGGVDLRRDEHWSFLKRWSAYLRPGVSTRYAYEGSPHKAPWSKEKISTLSRGGGQANNNSILPRQAPVHALSISEPFIPRVAIAEMTLSDIALTLKYAVESGRPGFDSVKFFKQGDHGQVIRDELKSILKTLDEAATKSRGFQIFYTGSSMIEEKPDYGNVDALQFCAAIRILAEWRLLRQVPDGYKGYAVGMSLGHKDIVQNLAKIESSVHEWLELYAEVEDTDDLQDDQMQSTTDLNIPTALLEKVEHTACCCKNDRVVKTKRRTLQSPTLRDLLVHEIHADIHPTRKLPQLKEKSAAMGLLWVRRQFHYQTSIFSNILRIPHAFASAVDAVSAAYTEVYGSLHGWAVQKIFNYSFQSAPDIHVIFRHMNPNLLKKLITSHHNCDLEETKGDNNSMVITDDAINDGSVESIMPVSDEAIKVTPSSEENNHGKNIFQHIMTEWENFGKQLTVELGNLGDHIGNEWDKLSSSLFGPSKNKNAEQQAYETRGGALFLASKSSASKLSGAALEELITKEMSSDARDRIKMFLNVAQPILSDLAGLFSELNMNDPTKV